MSPSTPVESNLHTNDSPAAGEKKEDGQAIAVGNGPGDRPEAWAPFPSLAPSSRFATQIAERARKEKEERVTLGEGGSSAESFFEHLQKEYQELKSTPPASSDSREELFRLFIKKASDTGSHLWSRSDWVLAYSIARAEGLQSLSKEWESMACNAYLKDRDAYDYRLGDLIPEDLRRWGYWTAAGRAYDGGANPTAVQDWEVFERRLANRTKQPLRGVTTGLPTLDQALLGLDRLTLLGGPTGCGKSALATFMIAAALKADTNLAALYLVLDPGMTRERVYERLWCLAAGLDSRSLYGPASEAVQQARAEGREHLRSAILARLKVIEVPLSHAGTLDGDAIAGYRNALQKATGAERVLVVIDYLGYLDVPLDVSPTSLDADVHRMNSTQEAHHASRTAKYPSGDPYLVIAETNKSWKGDAPLTADRLLGSARVAYSADAILMLEPQQADPAAPCVPVLLRVAKGRDGTVRTAIPLLFEHTRCIFREKALPATASAPRGRGRPKGGPGGIDPLAGMGDGKP